MTSFATEAAVREHVAERGLGQPFWFCQTAAPRLRPDGSLFVDADGTASLYGPGHGDVLSCIRSSGILAELERRGVESVVVSNVDNLGARVDPVVVGMHLLAGTPFTVEVVAKGDDTGGAPARVDGEPQLLEAMRFPPEFDQARIPVFNTNTSLITTAALREPVELTWLVVGEDGRRPAGGAVRAALPRALGPRADDVPRRAAAWASRPVPARSRSRPSSPQSAAPAGDARRAARHVEAARARALPVRAPRSSLPPGDDSVPGHVAAQLWTASVPIGRSMEAARDLRNQWPALGKLLIRDGALTPEQLEHALSLQRLTPGHRLGQIIVEQGYATSLDISRSVAEQHELEFVELELDSIDAAAAMLLPENLARHYQALPIRVSEDGYVLVAVADPTNVVFADELRLAIGMPVRLCVAAPESIEAAIVRLASRCRRPDRGGRDRRGGEPRIERACWICSTKRPPSSSSTGSSRRRSISGPRTSTSRRSNVGSMFGSGSTGSFESSPRSRERRAAWWRLA